MPNKYRLHLHLASTRLWVRQDLSQSTITLTLHGFPGSLTPLWPHDADVAEGGWIIFSRRFIMRSCSCRHWTCRRFCWCMARRTSLHVSSMARLDLLCCCNMACITRSFFLFMDRCLLACLFLAEVGWELEKRELTFESRQCLVTRDHLWFQELIVSSYMI